MLSAMSVRRLSAFAVRLCAKMPVCGPTTAHRVFLSEQLKNVDRGMFGDKMTTAASMWRTMDEGEKKSYERKAIENREIFKEEMQNLSPEQNKKVREQRKKRSAQLKELCAAIATPSLRRRNASAYERYLVSMKGTAGGLAELAKRWDDMAEGEKQPFERDADAMNEVRVTEDATLSEGRQSTLVKLKRMVKDPTATQNRFNQLLMQCKFDMPVVSPRGKSPYIVFVREFFVENVSKSFGELGAAAVKWRTLSDAQKAEYATKSAALKEEAQQALRRWAADMRANGDGEALDRMLTAKQQAAL